MSNLTDLELSVIRTDGGTQPRAQLDQGVVEEYAEAMKAGAIFPQVVVFHDGRSYWLADGFHRLTAANRAGLLTISVELRKGTRRDAVLYSASANATHGLRRTNADKRRAVATLLLDPEWSQWSDREIARRAGVSDRFVNNLRKELSPNGSQSITRKGADGRIINTANIGKRTKGPRDKSYSGPGPQETEANPVKEGFSPQPISPDSRRQLPPAITIDVAAETVAEEERPLAPVQPTPEPVSPSPPNPEQAGEELHPPAKPYQAGGRIRILCRQHGKDKWSGKVARIREITSDGQLRVDVEGQKGVRFTLNPEWVEPMSETPENYKVQPGQAPQQPNEPDPESPVIAGDAAEEGPANQPPLQLQAGDRLRLANLEQSGQQWVGEVAEVIEVGEDRVQVVIEIPRQLD